MNVHTSSVRTGARRGSATSEVAPAMPALERRRLQSYLALMCGDTAMLFAAFALAAWFYLGVAGTATGLVLAQMLLPVYLTIAFYNGAYSTRALEDADYGGARCVIALLVSSAVVVFIAFYTKSSEEFSRVVYSLGVITASLFLPWCRAQMRAFIRWRCGQSVVNELVIDDGGPSVNSPDVRHIDDRRYGLVPELGDPFDR